MMNLSEKIIKLRKQQGWSQEELAEVVSATQEHISRLDTECNDKQPARISHARHPVMYILGAVCGTCGG